MLERIIEPNRNWDTDKDWNTKYVDDDEPKEAKELEYKEIDCRRNPSRFKDKEFLNWLKGAFLHHAWKNKKSIEYDATCLTEREIHQKMIHGNGGLLIQKFNVFGIENGECKIIVENEGINESH